MIHTFSTGCCSTDKQKVRADFEHCSHERKMCETCLECKSVTAKNKHPNTELCKKNIQGDQIIFFWSQNRKSMNHSDF